MPSVESPHRYYETLARPAKLGQKLRTFAGKISPSGVRAIKDACVEATTQRVRGNRDVWKRGESHALYLPSPEKGLVENDWQGPLMLASSPLTTQAIISASTLRLQCAGIVLLGV